VSWYVSRPVSLVGDDGTYLVAEGIDPWNRHVFAGGPLGEHARWWLKLQQKHQRWPWQPWKLEPPQISSVRVIRTSSFDRLLGRLLVAWIVWRLARPW
jgi:hypothetical protein